jgi:hypothetical protein
MENVSANKGNSASAKRTNFIGVSFVFKFN